MNGGCGHGLGAAFMAGGWTLGLAGVVVAVVGGMVGALWGIDHGEALERARHVKREE